MSERKKFLSDLINALTDAANGGHIGAQMQIVEAQSELDEIAQIELNQLIMFPPDHEAEG